MKRVFILFLLLLFFGCAKKAPKVEEKKVAEEEEKLIQQKLEVVKKAEKLKFEEAKETLVPDPYVMFGLGLNKEKAGELEEASKFYSYAIELKPNMTDAWINLAEVKNKLGKQDERIKTLEEALQIIPEDPKIWSALAIAYADAGNIKKSEEILKKAINMVGMKKEIAKSLGYSFFRSGRYSLALFVFSEITSKYPDDPDAYFVMGEIYMRTKNFNKTIDFFKKGLSLKQDATIWNKLGLCYLEINAIDQAKEAFEKAISLDPNFYPPYVNLGIILKRKGDFENSEKMYLKALELKENDPDIIYNLANLYETIASYSMANPQATLQYIQKAKEYLSKYSELITDQKEKENIQKRLKKLTRSEKNIKRRLEREMKKLPNKENKPKQETKN